LRHTSVGEEVVGLSVNEVLSADGVGCEVSKRDQGRWDADGIVVVGTMYVEVSDQLLMSMRILRVFIREI
jgi:hypothetical protein